MGAALFIPVMAAPVAASYPGDCDTGYSATYQRFTAHQSTDGPYTGAAATFTYTRAFRVCVNGNLRGSWTGLFGANLERISGNTVVAMVQLGAIRVADGWDVHGATGTFFAWAPNDDNGPGEIFKVDWAPTPVIGHTYRLRIDSKQVPSGAWYWNFQIIDTTIGVTYRSGDVSGTFGEATRVWYGYEAKDSWDQIGGADTNKSALRISNTDFETTDQVWHDTSSSCYSIGSQSDFRCLSGVSGTQGYLDGYTINGT